MSEDTEILVVGAGPTGLVLALCLVKMGVRFRIIEKNSGPGQASRAMAVQARTLEFYRQLGFADRVIAGGLKMQRIHLRQEKEELASLQFGDFGAGLSPFPFVLSFPQDDHEKLLIELLKEAGVEVEWNTSLREFEDRDGAVQATIEKNGGNGICRAQYLCGCDGARSTVREGLKLQFPGGTYDQMFYVADVEASGELANSDINICLAARAFGISFPVRNAGQHRLIGIIPQHLADRQDLTFDDIRSDVEQQMDVRVRKVNWFSKYHVHHRVADHFRAGRVFIAGDAGHIHSPVGGQGMNTGIGDAVNLSWKLANVLQGRAAESILDSYEVERMAFAQSLVKTTDRLFQGVVGQGAGYRFFRALAPRLVAVGFNIPALRRLQFSLVSQIRIQYRDSALSEGAAGIHGGDRLPWVNGNFDSLKSFDWQVHVYGEPQEPLLAATAEYGLPVHTFPWNDRAADAGLVENAFYLIRPDGYVAVAALQQDVELFKQYARQWKITSHK